ncbi:HutD family protein [Pseudophaeobacter sp.]|uniref:HutD/Ves family protein n=1 Tax=Pseudophaeobacter sp. TaxID=1971739 RepID=UPI003A975CBF
MRFSVADIPVQAWKNGGGSTRELVCHRAGDSAEGAMLWRVSLATIEQDGVFSRFPGMARIHCIVAGAGLRLTGADLQLEAKPLQPLHFDGGLDLMAGLNDGGCTAFNLIYDPRKISAEIQILSQGTHPLPADAVVLFVLSGQADGTVFQRLSTGEGYHGALGPEVTLSDGGQAVLLRLRDIP